MKFSYQIYYIVNNKNLMMIIIQKHGETCKKLQYLRMSGQENVLVGVKYL